MKKESESFLTRWLSVLPGEEQAARIGAFVESAFCIGCSLMAFAVIGTFPVTATTIVVSFMFAVIGFIGSVGMAFESGLSYRSEQLPRWKNQLIASVAGLFMGAVAVYLNVANLLELFGQH